MAGYGGTGILDEIERLSLGQAREPLQLPHPSPSDFDQETLLTVDVTRDFSAAVQALSPGELVKDGFFSLYESVSALEIMDPKMDSGAGESEQDLMLEELYDVSWPLLPEEALGIMDQLLCHEAAWHLGYNLSMTLFTSFYLEALLMPDPKNIREAYFVRPESHDSNDHPMIQTLRAYCLGMLKTCGYVNERVKSEHFYEEEDFVTNTYNRTMLASIPTKDIRKVIADTRNLLKTLVGSVDRKVLQALDRRLEFRALFLDANESPRHMHIPPDLRKPWERVVKVLPDIKSTHTLGRPVEQAFNVKLQRKLASTMPPKPAVQLKFDDAFAHITRLFEDGVELASIFSTNDPQCILTFVHHFQAKKPQPLVYLRVLLQTYLFDSMKILGFMSIRKILDDDFRLVCLPASPLLDRTNDDVEFPKDPRYVMAEQMELFRKKAAHPFLDMLRTLCQNRCRIRRGLCHRILDWEILQIDAEEADQILRVRVKEVPVKSTSPVDGSMVEEYSLPLSSWAYLYKLRQMEWIVQFGFELEVYQKDELGGMYWYLNFLAKQRVLHLERIKRFVLHRFDTTRRPRSTATTVSMGREGERCVEFIRQALFEGMVTGDMADMLSCIYTILTRLGLVKAPLRPYSNDELRYQLRMRPFAPISSPPLPTYKQYMTGVRQPEVSLEGLLRYAEITLTSARKVIDMQKKLSPEHAFSDGSYYHWTNNINNGIKTCIAAKLAIVALQEAAKRKKKGEPLAIRAEVPTPDKAYHQWWIVPRIEAIEE